MASRTKQAQKKQPEVEFELPKGYENESVGFARAFEHAKKNGNNDKAALLYAQAWAHDFEYVEEDE